MLNDFVIIPEHVVESAAAAIADDPNNSFYTILRGGQEFKDAGMTPIYILDRDNMNVQVVAEETFGKKLN